MVDADVCDLEDIVEKAEKKAPVGKQNLRALYDQALRRLAQREYGEEELRRKLVSYAENPKDVETVLAQMKQAGQLSDARFIEAYIQSRVRRGFGPIRIIAELNEKGISSEEMKEHLSIWKSSWLSVAKRVLSKKYAERSMRSIDEEKKKALVLTQKRFLLYRGFESTTIREVFSKNNEAK